ncbi:hypothetical protein FOXB_01027 [Fusarium oxysporum f. sp. conglutinans Fo5176]|uniref:Uncharacterized protein n=1 Tax=Fusarium oxysporum (strain Fo5176) TaxID=660025 RepID=F9F3Q2_FUSOF|nr:hypothetical protein FOXB_01027 [Fusarium oxysporum f. sp. conglutinans Fo5176]
MGIYHTEEWLTKSLNKFSGVLDFPEASTVPDMYSYQETMEHSPNSIHNSARKSIQQKCGEFLKHGDVFLQPLWRDDEDEDE